VLWCPLYHHFRIRLLVVVPLVERDVPLALENLRRWNAALYPSVAGAREANVADLDDDAKGCDLSCDLVFYFAQDANRTLRSALTRAFAEAPAVRNAFTAVDVWSADLSPSDNRRSAIADTTGPNNLFFHLMDRLMEEGRYSHMWYMEPDVAALRRFWLDKVAWEAVSAAAASVWIKGTVHRKDNGDFSRTYLAHRFHFNGAALYDARDPLFRTFLHAARAYVRERPYDFGIDELLHDAKLWGDVQHLAHRFAYTDFVQNRHGDDITAEALLSAHPNTFFVHGLPPPSRPDSAPPERET